MKRGYLGTPFKIFVHSKGYHHTGTAVLAAGLQASREKTCRHVFSRKIKHVSSKWPPGRRPGDETCFFFAGAGWGLTRHASFSQGRPGPGRDMLFSQGRPGPGRDMIFLSQGRPGPGRVMILFSQGRPGPGRVMISFSQGRPGLGRVMFFSQGRPGPGRVMIFFAGPAGPGTSHDLFRRAGLGWDES